jgi:hypothetical protein
MDDLREAEQVQQSASNELLSEFCTDIRNKLGNYSTLIELTLRFESVKTRELKRDAAIQGQKSLDYILGRLEDLERGDVR